MTSLDTIWVPRDPDEVYQFCTEMSQAETFGWFRKLKLHQENKQKDSHENI